MLWYLLRVKDICRIRYPNPDPCWPRSNNLSSKVSLAVDSNNSPDSSRYNKSLVYRLKCLFRMFLRNFFGWLTDAVGLILALNESWVAETIIGTVRIDAPAIFADAFFFAFIFIVAPVCIRVSRLTHRTLACERTHRVHAVTTDTEMRNRLTFIDI